MEGDVGSLDLALLDVDLVAAENNGDVLADTLEVTVPVGDVLVGDTRGHIEHDDTALALDVVAVTETTELLLAGSVPDVEADGALEDVSDVFGCVLTPPGGRCQACNEGCCASDLDDSGKRGEGQMARARWQRLIPSFVEPS